VKSGSDFQNASLITLNVTTEKSERRRLVSVEIEKLTLDSSIEEDRETQLIVSSYLGNYCISSPRCSCTSYLSVDLSEGSLFDRFPLYTATQLEFYHQLVPRNGVTVFLLVEFLLKIFTYIITCVYIVMCV